MEGHVEGHGDGALHGEDRGSAADVENDLVLKKVLVLHNGIHV